MQKTILEEHITYEGDVRVHRQLIEKRVTKAEDMVELGQLYMTLGRLETQVEGYKERISLDPENRLTYEDQIQKVIMDQETIRKAIEIQNKYISGFNEE